MWKSMRSGGVGPSNSSTKKPSFQMRSWLMYGRSPSCLRSSTQRRTSIVFKALSIGSPVLPGIDVIEVVDRRVERVGAVKLRDAAGELTQVPVGVRAQRLPDRAVGRQHV